MSKVAWGECILHKNMFATAERELRSSSRPSSQYKGLSYSNRSDDCCYSYRHDCVQVYNKASSGTTKKYRQHNGTLTNQNGENGKKKNKRKGKNEIVKQTFSQKSIRDWVRAAIHSLGACSFFKETSQSSFLSLLSPDTLDRKTTM